MHLKNAFQVAQEIESDGIKLLLPLLNKFAFSGKLVHIGDGRRAEELQKVVGDFCLTGHDDKLYTVEVKVDTRDETGNLFLETWSNKQRFTPGWMVTGNFDVLLYHFINIDMVLSINFQKLKGWAFGTDGMKGRVYDFREVKQNRFDQKNDTHGRIVPITIIEKEVGIKIYDLKHESEIPF